MSVAKLETPHTRTTRRTQHASTHKLLLNTSTPFRLGSQLGSSSRNNGSRRHINRRKLVIVVLFFFIVVIVVSFPLAPQTIVPRTTRTADATPEYQDTDNGDHEEYRHKVSPDGGAAAVKLGRPTADRQLIGIGWNAPFATAFREGPTIPLIKGLAGVEIAFEGMRIAGFL